MGVPWRVDRCAGTTHQRKHRKHPPKILKQHNESNSSHRQQILTMAIHLGGSKDNVIQLETTRLDCSKLFSCETAATFSAGAGTYTLLHNKHKVLKLDALNSLRTTGKQLEFLPTKIYVRDCMQEIFNKIVWASNPNKYCIIFGSPGVGKSVLSFLAALCFVRYEKKPLLFLRKTTKKTENISVFWITPDSNGKLKVEFSRMVRNTNKLQTVHEQMLEYIFKEEIDRNDYSRVLAYHDHLRSICDGPLHGDVDHVGSSDLVTSGGYDNPKNEAETEIYALPLSAWTMKEVIRGCWNLFKVKAQRAKEIFDVSGGNIRKATEVINETATLAKMQRAIILVVDTEGSLEALKLALESTKLSSDEKSIERLRTMFAVPEGDGYTTVQYIGSPYLFRKVRTSLTLEETLAGLRRAKNSGIQSLHGWHFELFGHKIFQLSHKRQVDTKPANNPSPPPEFHEFVIVEGKGTGKQSVEQLVDISAYWTPSTSNFANIDAAIAPGDTLYCIQYTVSELHTFNFCTFASDFWGVLLTGFRDKIKKIIVVFVVPHEQTFKKVVIPKSQETLSAVANSTCCNGLEKVFRKGKKDSGDGNGEEPKNHTTKEENIVANPDGDVKMSSSDGDDVQYLSDDESTFFDDDCGEEGFDGVDDKDGDDDHDTSMSTLAPIHFQWEERSEIFDVDQAPLSFLKKEDSM